jgi:hypothetical protein
VALVHLLTYGLQFFSGKRERRNDGIAFVSPMLSAGTSS